MPFTVLRHEKMTLSALVHIIEEPEDDYSCRGIKQDREKGGKRMKQLAETSRRRKPASGRQNMFGKRSAARLKVIINFWKNPSRSCQQSRFTFFPSRCGAATFLLRSFARFFLSTRRAGGCWKASRHSGHLCWPLDGTRLPGGGQIKFCLGLWTPLVSSSCILMKH